MSEWMGWLALAAYIGSLWNLVHAMAVRDRTGAIQHEIDRRLAEWRAAGMEAHVLWEYGARAEALRVLAEAGLAKQKDETSSS